MYHITSHRMSLRFDGSSINPLVSSYLVEVNSLQREKTKRKQNII